MSHEPGRERHMIYQCENCGHTQQHKMTLHETHDEYWCESCFDNEAEAAYNRQQERDLESPPESAREEQLRTWEEHQKAHSRSSSLDASKQRQAFNPLNKDLK